MDLWYSFHKNGGSLPEQYRGATLWDIQRDLGIGIFGFGAWDISFFRLRYRTAKVEKKTENGLSVTTYETPFGTLTSRDQMAQELKEAAGTGARTEYPFKEQRDYDALRFLVEDTEVLENFEVYGNFMESIGGDGLALPFSGHLPAHQLMLNLMGYQRFYYEISDNPNQMDALLEALTDQQLRILQLGVRSTAPAIEVGANYDEEMTPPPVFDTYFAPFYRKARETLSASGKILVVHGDGEMNRLLRCLMDCGVQVVEALTPKPMTSIDIAETRRTWADRVAMWGGLASVILTDTFGEEEFEAYLDRLFRDVAPGRSFILGFGDNVPTDALFDRIKRVARYWADNGNYPLRP